MTWVMWLTGLSPSSLVLGAGFHQLDLISLLFYAKENVASLVRRILEGV
ncbi:MAG: hypothetical protein LBI10_07575 [Deltaproteobacteria bacterium]|nr:hypothetical protein [Deltaproteobacteria bacterium]